MHFVLCSEQIWMTVCKDSNVRLVRTQREDTKRERDWERQRTKKHKEQRIGNFEGEEIFNIAQSHALGDVHLCALALREFFFANWEISP